MAARLVRKNILLALGSGVVTPIKPFTRLPLFLTLLSKTRPVSTQKKIPNIKGQKGQNTHIKVENWLQARRTYWLHRLSFFNCRGYQKDSFLKERGQDSEHPLELKIGLFLPALLGVYWDKIVPVPLSGSVPVGFQTLRNWWVKGDASRLILRFLHTRLWSIIHDRREIVWLRNKGSASR